MGEYANVKSKRFVRVLNWLANHKGVELKQGGRHNYKIICVHNSNSYAIPSSHYEINKRIVKAFGEWLVKNTICTKDEYDSQL